MTIHAIAPAGRRLTDVEVRSTLASALEGQFAGQRLLVLIPDHTRTLPLPFLFRTLVELLGDTKRLDFMVALGTHPALQEASLQRLVGIDADERTTIFKHIGLLNHAWDRAEKSISFPASPARR
ncbi:MAG: lactate racemase domain-containing protein [Anaerolineales bacterium]